MTPDSHSPTEVASTAAEWLAKHDRGLSPRETADFLRWINANPRHAEEWDSMLATWKQADTLELVPELAAQAAAVDERTRHAAARRTVFRRYGVIGLAAAAAIAVGIAMWSFRVEAELKEPAAVTFVAAEGRALHLPDGSLVSVRGNSKVRYDLSGDVRRLVLSSGEAFFDVAKDPSRPFVVEVNGVVVRAVGTAFNVRRADDGINVIVTEGRVRVATPGASGQDAPLVAAGEKMQVEERTGAPAPAARPIAPTEIETALKWRSPQLAFNHASLTSVLAAFGEYSAQRIELGDPSLAQRTISGTFRADNIDGFLRLAELSFGMKVERGADGLVTLYPAR